MKSITWNKRWNSFIIGIFILVSLTNCRVVYYKGIPPKPNKEEWIEDVSFLADKMNKIYPELYKKVTEAEFNKVVEEIKSAIPSMSDDEIIMELFRLITILNDAHSIPAFFIPCFDLHSFPFDIYCFTDGWHVVNTKKSLRNIDGAKLLKIGNMHVDDVFKLSKSHLSAENITAQLDRGKFIMLTSEWLMSMGIIENSKEAEFTFELKNGEVKTLSIPSTKSFPKIVKSTIKRIDNDLPPVYSNGRKDNYHFKMLTDSKTLYVQLNAFKNQKGHETMNEFSRNLQNFAVENEFDRIVIDLRNNQGGSDQLYEKLLSVIRDNENINKEGKLFVLIGRQTFSAAVLFAYKLKLQTKAIFVGEPTSQGPIFNANPKFVKLPNSGLMFSISKTSTARSQPLWEFDTKDKISQDITAMFSYDDFKKGIDPALEAVINYKIDKRTYDKIELKEYTGRYVLSPFRIIDIESKNKLLHMTINDFVPNSLFYVQSELYASSVDKFDTNNSNVKIEFIKDKNKKASDLKLIWDNEELVGKRAPEDFNLPFECFSQGNIEKGVELLLDQKENYLHSFTKIEVALNTLGYSLLWDNEINKALKILKLNTLLFPNSWNAFDSYGEACLANGDKNKAMKNYTKSVELNPKNIAGKKMVKKIKGMIQ
ncbi:S41 family peptidase [Lentimicrobium sp. S6]|uniref:S41 family peptidase n=1 Tax=Lentimicrobium sp. S6 TaxID=2735872 RepID=UPI001553CF75|nr:S41 family peptidase [Lentimicrobium sp. S6]NPD48062.1 hypothetical protein [Lentimicrobium sp. S6]